MARRENERDRAETQLISELQGLLIADGWEHLPGTLVPGSFTHDVGADVIATLLVLPIPIVSEQEWPLPVDVQLGVGLVPALALGPLLTDRVRAALLLAPDQSRHLESPFNLANRGDTARLARDIAEAANTRGLTFARGFPDGHAILAALTEPPSPKTEDARERSRHDRRPFLAAAAIGELSTARQLLNQLVAAAPDSTRPGSSRGRFLRQAGRWLDAGGPQIPPLAEVLPPEPAVTGRSRPTLIAILTNIDQIRDAELRLRRRVRRNPGQDAKVLRAALAEDYAAHNVRRSPVQIAATVERVTRVVRPLGRVREIVATRVPILLRATGTARVLIRDRRFPRDSSLETLPDSATYPIPVQRDSWAQVRLQAQGVSALRRVAATTERRIGPLSFITVWLGADPTDGNTIDVHVGDTVVGFIEEPDSRAYAWVIDAARKLEEQPVTAARFLNIEHPVLEILLPVPLYL